MILGLLRYLPNAHEFETVHLTMKRQVLFRGEQTAYDISRSGGSGHCSFICIKCVSQIQCSVMMRTSLATIECTSDNEGALI